MAIHCSICNTELTDPMSMIAGIGPDCHKKIRFCENLQPNELLYMAGGKSPAKQLKNHKTKIIKYKEDSDEVKVITTLNKIDEKNFLAYDRKKATMLFNRHESMAKAISDSIFKFNEDDIDYFCDIHSPNDPDLKRAYNQYVKEHTNIINYRTKIEKEILERGLNKFYQKVSQKQHMSKSQLIAREELMDHKKSNEKDYKFKWNNGLYQRATWMSRMKKTNNNETSNLLKVLENNKHYRDLEIIDHGLTDEEIYNGLRNSNQKLEAILFKSYIESNRNLRLMVSLFKNIPQLEATDKRLRLKAILCLSKMSTGKPYTKEDLKKDLSD